MQKKNLALSFSRINIVQFVNLFCETLVQIVDQQATIFGIFSQSKIMPKLIFFSNADKALAQLNSY